MFSKSIVLSVLGALSSHSCKHETQVELYELRSQWTCPYILQAYDWQQKYEGEDESLPFFGSKITPGIPEDEFYLFEDTSFVLRVPEYANSKQPFLAHAEDFYNSCAISWNVYSNFEVWYRGQTSRSSER